jgi:hypothetical protein
MPDYFETRYSPNTGSRSILTALLTISGVALIVVSNYVAANYEPTMGKAKPGPFPAFLGFFLLLAAFILAFNHPDFAIDKVKRRYRHFVWLLGLRIGSWQQYAQVTGVVVKYFSEYTVADRRSWQVNTPEQSYIVMLSSKPASHKAIIVHKFSFQQKEQAVRVATELANYLAVPFRMFDEQP